MEKYKCFECLYDDGFSWKRDGMNNIKMNKNYDCNKKIS